MHEEAYYTKMLSNTEDTICFSYTHILLETTEQLFMHRMTPHWNVAHTYAQYLRIELGANPNVLVDTRSVTYFLVL
jgi:hypothetical protein